jgi:hypothetical protein
MPINNNPITYKRQLPNTTFQDIDYYKLILGYSQFM